MKALACIKKDWFCNENAQGKWISYQIYLALLYCLTMFEWERKRYENGASPSENVHKG